MAVPEATRCDELGGYVRAIDCTICIVIYKLVQQGLMDRWHYALQLLRYIHSNQS